MGTPVRGQRHGLAHPGARLVDQRDGGPPAPRPGEAAAAPGGSPGGPSRRNRSVEGLPRVGVDHDRGGRALLVARPDRDPPVAPLQPLHRGVQVDGDLAQGQSAGQRLDQHRRATGLVRSLDLPAAEGAVQRQVDRGQGRGALRHRALPVGDAADQCLQVRMGRDRGPAGPDSADRAAAAGRLAVSWRRPRSSASQPSGRSACQTPSSRSTRSRQRSATGRPYAAVSALSCSPRSLGQHSSVPSLKTTVVGSAGSSR